MPGHTSYLLAVQAPTCTGLLVHQSLCLSQKGQALQSPIFSGMVVVFTSCCSAPKPLLYVLLCDAGVRVCKLCFWETFARWLPISWWTVSGENWRDIGRWKEVEELFLFLVLVSLQEKQQQSIAMASVPSFIWHSPNQLHCSLLKVPAPASHTLPEFWAPACMWGPLLTSSRPSLFSFVPKAFDS